MDTSKFAIDLWVRQDLARAYDTVLDEAVPDQLLSLINSLVDEFPPEMAK